MVRTFPSSDLVLLADTVARRVSTYPHMITLNILFATTTKNYQQILGCTHGLALTVDHVRTEIVTQQTCQYLLIEIKGSGQRIVGVKPEGGEVGQKAIHSQGRELCAFIRLGRRCRGNSVRVCHNNLG